MKKHALIILISLFAVQIISAQSKVAVLDASLGAGVDANASAIVADTLNEQFVKSKDFIAIDRAYISSIQEEKKFQLSGDVNSDDIKELGATFGAKYLCIANVSQLGSTYTVSARLIEVETAQVVSQESARQRGQIDVLFNVAEEVGAKLIGKGLAEQEEKAKEAELVPSKKQPAARTGKKPGTFSRTTVSYMIPSFHGSGYDLMTDNFDAILTYGWNTWSGGVDVHSLMTFRKYYYAAVSGSYGFEFVTNEYDDSENSSLSILDLRATVGGVYPALKNLQIYAGLGLGLQYFVLGEYWLIVNEAEAGAFVYGIEIGTDYKLNNLVLSLRFQTGSSTFPASTVFDGYDEDFGYTALMIGVGFVF